MIEQMLRGMTLCDCFQSNPTNPGCGNCTGGYIQTRPRTTSREDKADVLTAWKEEDRYDHEVYAASGVADPAVRRGIFHRAWNRQRPDLNSRDGHYPVRRAQSYMDDGPGDGGGYDSAEE